MEPYHHDHQDQLAVVAASTAPVAVAGAAVPAEERQLQLDFHALLAHYIVGRRRVEAHPDAEQRCVCVFVYVMVVCFVPCVWLEWR